MENWKYIALGALLWPCFLFGRFLARVTRVAFHDVVDLVKRGQLKNGRSTWNWIWIVPLGFCLSWGETARDELLHGLRREI